MNKVISIRTNPQSPTHAPNEEDASAAKKKSDADASSPPAPSETTGWVEPTDGAGSVLPGAADEDICIDEFGFCLTPEERAREKEFLRSVNQAQMSRRETKWEVMVQQWSQMIQRHPAKVKARARKGIHPKVRPTVWRLECGVGDVYNVQPSFQDYLEMGCDAVKAYIDRDLNRTFPTHVLFKETDSVGQVYLKNVLYAYAACDPEVGYCQGMGFVVATLLTQMEQEDAFWCLHHMMYNPKLQLRELYRPGFPLLNQFFYQLKGVMKIFLPGLADHFEKEGVDSAFYATQWFLTIFSYHFPFRVTLRVWDAFLHEGWKVVFRIGIALFSLHRVELMGLRFEELVTRLKTLCDGKNDEELMNASLKINLKTRQLEKLKEKYLEEKKSQPAPETK